MNDVSAVTVPAIILFVFGSYFFAAALGNWNTFFRAPQAAWTEFVLGSRSRARILYGLLGMTFIIFAIALFTMPNDAVRFFTMLTRNEDHETETILPEPVLHLATDPASEAGAITFTVSAKTKDDLAILVQDPLGRKTGLSTLGNEHEEIPDSAYFIDGYANGITGEPPKTFGHMIGINSLKNGPYTFFVEATGDVPIDISVLINGVSSNSAGQSFSKEDTAKPNAPHVFVVDVQQL